MSGRRQIEAEKSTTPYYDNEILPACLRTAPTARKSSGLRVQRTDQDCKDVPVNFISRRRNSYRSYQTAFSDITCQAA